MYCFHLIFSAFFRKGELQAPGGLISVLVFFIIQLSCVVCYLLNYFQATLLKNFHLLLDTIRELEIPE